jgi:hypothetical protein
MPAVTPAATDKTSPASVGIDSTAAWGAADMHPATTDMHPAAAAVHPAAPTVAAPATMAAATTVRSEYGSGDEQADGDCGD